MMLIPKASYLAAQAGDVFYVAEEEGKVIGVMGLDYRHVETNKYGAAGVEDSRSECLSERG